jgi:hypothetical protein
MVFSVNPTRSHPHRHTRTHTLLFWVPKRGVYCKRKGLCHPLSVLTRQRPQRVGVAGLALNLAIGLQVRWSVTSLLRSARSPHFCSSPGTVPSLAVIMALWSSSAVIVGLSCGKKLWQNPLKIAFSLKMSQGTTPANARTRAKTRAFCPPAWVLKQDYPQPRDRPRSGKVFV